MREEKKYEILPGTEIPDMKKIQEAASDFSVSDVGEVEIRTVTFQPVAQPAAPGVSVDELNQLQELGAKVAADEAKAQAESRAKMDKIMQNVKAPESIQGLKESHFAQVNAEKRKELEENMKEFEQQQAEDEAKTKAREERRQLQQRLLEEAKQKAAKEREEKERAKQEQAEKEAEAKQAEAAASEDKPEENSPVVKKTAKVVSDNEAFEDFKEFLDDSDNE
jgi:hypothetical protein